MTPVDPISLVDRLEWAIYIGKARSLSHTKVAVLKHIVFRGGPPLYQCWQSIDGIALDCCLGTTAVKAAVIYLVEAGLVQRRRRFGQSSILIPLYSGMDTSRLWTRPAYERETTDGWSGDDLSLGRETTDGWTPDTSLTEPNKNLNGKVNRKVSLFRNERMQKLFEAGELDHEAVEAAREVWLITPAEFRAWLMLESENATDGTTE